MPVGARVMVTFLKEDGHVADRPSRSPRAGTRTVTISAVRWTSQQYWDGSLLVSDDLVGAIYRIWYDGK